LDPSACGRRAFHIADAGLAGFSDFLGRKSKSLPTRYRGAVRLSVDSLGLKSLLEPNLLLQKSSLKPPI
jgi:hypothetical protein